MSFVAALSVTITTAADGSATGYIDCINGGLLLGISYVKPSSGGFDNNVTLVVTVAETGQPVVSFGAGAIDASLVTYPRAQVHSVAAGGTGLTLDGTRINAAPIPICAGHRLKFVIAAGGNAKVGTFYAQVG